MRQRRETLASSDLRTMHRRRLMALLAIAFVPAVVILLYAVPPVPGSIYPPCPFRWATGLHCPGCGTGRGMHAALHGRFAQFAAYNIAAVIAAPFLLLSGLRVWYYAMRGQPCPSRTFPRGAIWALLLAMLLYWLLRNVPVYPLSLLAPHEI
jgi:hypothetical protein